MQKHNDLRIKLRRVFPWWETNLPANVGLRGCLFIATMGQPSGPLEKPQHAQRFKRIWLGRGTERCSTSSASHRAERQARWATVGRGICW